MEQFNAFWESIKPYVLSVTSNTAFTAVIMAVVTALIKNSINKKFDANTMKKLYDNAFESIFDRIKNMIISINIEPLVTKRLKAMEEVYSNMLNDEINELRDMNRQQTMLIGALLGYFDNSMIPENVKANAKAIYNDTMSMYEPDPKVEAVIEVKEEPKKEKKANNITIER